MRRDNISAILEDLDDLISRAKDAGLPVARLEAARVALTPTCSCNSLARERASECFRRARESLAGVK